MVVVVGVGVVVVGAAKAACRQKSAKRASLIIVYSFVLGRI